MGGGGNKKPDNNDKDDFDHLPKVAEGWPLPYQFSIAAAAVYCALFCVSALIHTYQLGRTRTWFLIPLLIGVWLEALGYLFRTIAAAAYPKYQQWPVFFTILLPFIAPTLMAASLYMELGRIIRMCGAERLSIIKPTWMTKIFVLGDVVTLIGQVIGGSLMANPKASESQIKLARTINTVAFSLQVAFLVLYILTAVIFHNKYGAQCRANKAAEQLPWGRHLKALYLAVCLVLYRTLFHLVQYIGEFDFFTNREWPMFLLDTTPMLLVAVLFIFVHPSEINAILNGRGLVCRNVFRFSRAPPPAKFQALYAHKHAGASYSSIGLQPLGSNDGYHSQTQAMFTPAQPSSVANVGMKPYHSGPNYRYGDQV